MIYYIKGGSRYNELNPTVWTALILGGYNEATYYEDANWKLITYNSLVQNQDPFWLLGSASGGAKQSEFGLYNDNRIIITTTEISAQLGYDPTGKSDSSLATKKYVDDTAGGAPDEEVKVFEGGVQVGTVARKLDFNNSDFNITEDAGNDQFDVAIAEIALTKVGSYSQGAIIKGGVSDWETLTLGIDGYFLKAGASDISWAQLTESDISDLDHNDVDAIHDNIANEITAVTPKITPSSADEFIIEDSGASYVKKALTFGNLESTIAHSNINDDEAVKHRLINDAGTLTTELWSANKINTDLGGKADDPHGNTQHSSTFITAVSEDATPQLGASLDLNDKGITHEFTAAVSLVNGDLCYMNASGKMAKAQANAEATCDTLLAMCLDTIAADATGTFLLLGKYTTSGLTQGNEYFVDDTTAGAITNTRPSTTGDIIRHVGTALSTTVLFFNPDHTYVEYTA